MKYVTSFLPEFPRISSRAGKNVPRRRPPTQMFLLFVFLLLIPVLPAAGRDSSTRTKSSPTRRLATNRAHGPAMEARQWKNPRSGVLPLFSPSGSSETETIRFAVIGDYGLEGEMEAEVAALVLSWDPDFIITTGDNNYPDGAAETIDQNIGQYYSDFISPYIGAYGQGAPFNRFFPSLGNHDWDSEGAQPYLDYFTLPGNERYYDFVWGSVHFFAIDSDLREPDGVTSDSDQAAWLQTALAASKAPWKIVYMHHLPFSSAIHGSTDRMQWPYEAWGATAVLAGHDHTYERIERDGFPYFVNGLGGNGIYSFWEPVEGSQARYNGDHGAMLVDASSEAITFQFISRTGEVIDIYTPETLSPVTGFYTLPPCRLVDTRGLINGYFC